MDDYFAMRLVDYLTIFALIFGPVFAVALTLWVEARRRRREQQLVVARLLINTRHMSGDPGWSIAVNMVPVEFADKPTVVDAWRAYMQSVRYTPTEENRGTHLLEVQAKQTAMIFQVLKSLGFNITEGEIQTQAYVAGGYITRDNLYLDSLKALRDIADVLKGQLAFIQAQVARNQPPPVSNEHESDHT